MSKCKVKIIIIVLAIIFICTGIVINIGNNRAQAYDESNIVVINLTPREFGRETNEYYCLNKGLEYAPGRYIDVGEVALSTKVAYAIGYEQNERQLGKTDPDDDAVANIVWYEMGTTHNGKQILKSKEYIEIEDASVIIQDLKDDDVSITLQNEELIGNSNSEYGPFQIQYPDLSIQGNKVGKTTIIVNGNTVLDVDDLTKKQDGYYLTEDQGIKQGEQNTVEIKYTVNNYSGTCDWYIREQVIYWDCKCSECEAEGYGQIYGKYYNKLNWEPNKDSRWEWFMEHNDGCTEQGEIIFGEEQYTKDNYQDIIKPEIEVIPITLSTNVKFYAGKSKLELYIKKVDTNGKELDGAKFDIGGVSEENSKIQDGILIIKAKKGEDTITVKFIETQAPEGYILLEEPIEITYKWDNENRKWIYEAKDSEPATDGEIIGKFKLTTGEEIRIIKEDDNRFKIQVENRKMITISGQVWLDGQTGIKPVKEPNGLKDEDTGVPGVLVRLVDSNNKIIAETKTEADGKYEFKDVPETPKDITYHIEFVYDGINYVATTKKGDSDAKDIDREAFNDKFHTITREEDVDVAISKPDSTKPDSTKTELKYDYISTEDGKTEAKIQTMDGDSLNSKYAITAKTEEATYNKDTIDIDLGLVKKGVDLAAITEIYSATLKINGKEKEYTYNDIQSLATDEKGNPILTGLEDESKKYNLYLYNSDYNYRIGDYKLDAAHKDSLTVVEKYAGTELLSKRQADGDLSVEVTYQILLNNQSATNATINEIAYYYDARYDLSEMSTTLINTTSDVTFQGTEKIKGIEYNKLIIKVKPFDSGSNQIVGNIVFIMKKDNMIGEVKNWVEIVSYSTNDGCIDEDSAPNNITKHIDEDDTDDAAGLNIQLNSQGREIRGYVFEDIKTDIPAVYNKGNGLYDADEQKINDVIVQLIEIKNVIVGGTTLKLEYIWQETVSGSGKVRYVTSDGTAEDEYTVEGINDGEYVFNEHIIPGNYIVRFIYGDGTYWDTATNTDNIIKYNGQDYKSTIDKEYVDGVYLANSSMARDNEARRLEEMAYATGITAANANMLIIDKEKDTEDEIKAKLDKTWMCAETNQISLNVSENPSESHSMNPIVKKANFGLVERPRAKLQLEKHITGLKLGIIDAIAGWDKYDALLGEGGLVETTALNVKAFASDTAKNERGLWTIETKIDEIQNQKLEVIYSYRISNIGDIEYIGINLKNKLIDGEAAGNTKEEIYEDIINTVKEASATSYSVYKPGYYLGDAYYSGIPGSNDTLTTIPFQVEDYLSKNGGLQQNGVTSNFTEISNADRNIWNYTTTGGSSKDFTENIRILRSDRCTVDSGTQSKYLNLNVSDNSIDTTRGQKDFKYRSYAAQLIYPTTGTITSESGTLCNSEMTLGNLETVQSYVDNLSSVPVDDIVPEKDEFIAETIQITIDTGADKQTPMVLIVTVTAGLAIVAVGIVLIKKFIIR